MSDADLEEIRDAAGRNNLTVSAWVRRTVRDAAGARAARRCASVHEARPDYSVFKPGTLRYVTIEARVTEHDVEAVRRRYGLHSWKAAAEEAVCRQAIVPMTKEEALAMQGVGWDGDLDEIRDNDPIELIDPLEPIE